jgi:hypothetical protein
MRQLSWRVPLLLILIGLGGCSTNPLGLDSRLFSDGACKAPCWQGLTPGESTSEDVDQFLDHLSTKDWPGRDIRLTNVCKSIRVTDTDDISQAHALADLYIQGGKLTFVESTPTVGLGPTLKRVTNHFGPPEYFEAVKYTGTDYNPTVLEVYYPSKGLAFQLPIREGDVDRIDPEMQVLSIQYFEPVKMQVEDFVQTWSGFGEVRVVTEGPPGQ